MADLKVLTVSSIKGGVGKTVSAVNISSIMAEIFDDSNVILIDLDPQGNASEYFGFTPDNLEVGTRELFENKDCKMEEVLNKTYRKNLFVVPSDITLTNVELSLNLGEIEGYDNEKTILRDKIEDYKSRLKKNTIIVLDTRPDFNIFTMNALMATERVVCPIYPGKFALRGFDILLNTTMTIRERYNRKLRLLGIFRNNWGKANSNVIQGLEKELEEFKPYLLDTVIPSTVDVEKSINEETPLINSSLKSKAVTKSYIDLVQEIIVRWAKVVR